MRPGALSAPTRHPAALLTDQWHRAVQIRREWLEIGLVTEPADRPTAEQSITEIYARHHRARPTFVWVDSPRAALPHLRDLPTHETLRSWIRDRRPPGKPPIASDIAAGLSRFRSELDDGYLEPARERPSLKRKKGDPWPVLRPDAALAAGLPFQELLRQGVRDALFRSLADGVCLPIRAALPGPLPIGWYGHQDAAWVAYFDTLQRLGLARYGTLFELWATLTRACGWWWPGEDRCVLVERPAILRTAPIPGAWHDEVRLHPDPGKPAVEYRDGWTV
ncbi:DUF6745 domain-containing protein [Micromonosporaceae bacterium Da 78-11]